MLRDGKETLFFSKVLLSTEILGLKTAHFTGQKKNKTKKQKKKKKKQRNKREKKTLGPYKAAFSPAPSLPQIEANKFDHNHSIYIFCGKILNVTAHYM